MLVKDKAGNLASLKWSITVKSKFGSKQAALNPNDYHWSGFFNYETMYGYVGQQPAYASTYLPFRPYGVNRGRLQVDGRGPDDTYQLKVYKTDEERSDQQPTDRYTALMKSDEGIIALGDYSPSFSELSLYNPFFFGVTVDLRFPILDPKGTPALWCFWADSERRGKLESTPTAAFLVRPNLKNTCTARAGNWAASTMALASMP